MNRYHWYPHGKVWAMEDRNGWIRGLIYLQANLNTPAHYYGVAPLCDPNQPPLEFKGNNLRKLQRAMYQVINENA